MIFSKFFKAKWQNKDSNIRITAINDELNTNEHKDILINLAQKDDNELVRRAALIKLADFEIFLNESENNSNKKIKEYAQKQVTKVLLGEHNITLDKEKKRQYISSVQNLTGLETWLTHETEEALIIALFEKINKPQLLTSLFLQKQQSGIQHYLLKHVNDKSQLEKLLKKACNKEISTQITDKIAEIDRLIELPKAISKKAQLNLSKFLALTDVANYVEMLDKKTKIINEWTCLQLEFDCLTAQEKEVFTTKHETIKNQIEKIFAPKAEAHQQKLIEIKLEQERDDAKNFFIAEIEKISQALTLSIFEDTEVDEMLFELTYTRTLQQLNASVLLSDDKKHFSQLLQKEQQKLTQLPKIAESVSKATQLIAKISQLTLPTTNIEFNERQPVFDDWKVQWQDVEKNASGVLPDSITGAKNDITSTWNKGLAPFIAEQKKLLTQSQKKINELKRIISSGKFNIAFGVFKRIEKTVSQLSARNKSKIQKDFDVITEKMAELSDWESYIATPRKQQLLADVKALVNTPLDNPNDQAAKVKEFRTKWNSLGHADEGLESKLNNEFNEYCEQAFAPCRLFYKEQEKIREQNLAARLTVLEELSLFTQSYNVEPIDSKKIELKLNKFNQQWHNAGEVERYKYREIQNQYNTIVDPIKKLLRKHHEDNAQLKKSLIQKAKNISTNEDVIAAIQTVKELQIQWKNVGYSGVKLENKLWKEFRSINDLLFKKRDELNEANKVQQKTLIDQLNTQLDDLQNIIKTENTISDLEKSKINAQSILSQAIMVKPVNKKFVSKIEFCVTSIDDKVTQIKNDKDKQSWQSIFTVLNQLCDNKNKIKDIQSTDVFNSLSTAWKKRLTEVSQKNNKVDRHEDTLMLEILSGQESPEAFKEHRMQVQVKLMQEQMLSGNSVNLKARFIDWLQKGEITESDIPLLNRIKPIYC